MATLLTQEYRFLFTSQTLSIFPSVCLSVLRRYDEKKEATVTEFNAPRSLESGKAGKTEQHEIPFNWLRRRENTALRERRENFPASFPPNMKFLTTF